MKDTAKLFDYYQLLRARLAAAWMIRHTLHIRELGGGIVVMKHKRTLMGIAMAIIMLAAIWVVCAKPVSVDAANGSGNAPAQPSANIVGAPYTGAPAVAIGGSYEYRFAKDKAGVTCYNEWAPAYGWVGWRSLGGHATSDPACLSISHGSGISDQELWVVVRGDDGAPWYRHSMNGGHDWSTWQSLNGKILAGTGPTICSWGWQTHVFVTGTDGALWHTWLDTSWHGWENDGKPSFVNYLTSSPAATAKADGALDVFCRCADGALWDRSYDHGWKPWVGLSGGIYPGTGPGACSFGGIVCAFVEGNDHALWARSYDSSHGVWSQWFIPKNPQKQPDGGFLTSSPAAATDNDGARLYVYVRGKDNFLWEKTYDFSGSGQWGWWMGPWDGPPGGLILV